MGRKRNRKGKWVVIMYTAAPYPTKETTTFYDKEQMLIHTAAMRLRRGFQLLTVYQLHGRKLSSLWGEWRNG
jgi:hypothetical protein